MSSRSAIRSASVLRAASKVPVRAGRQQIRFQSTQQAAQTTPAAAGGSGLVGGIAGGALVFAAGYGYYSYSGAKTVVDSAAATKKQLANITQTLKDKAPEPNEALKWFRQTATSYAAFIPGGKKYVDAAFNDLDTIEKKHRGELDQLVSDAYGEMRDATKSGLTMETAYQSWEVLQKYMAKVSELAADASSEILDNHPEIKEKVGPKMDELKNMANQYGPDAKKELDRTYDQIKEVVAGGVGLQTVNQIRKIIQEKTEKLQSLGDEAWKKGMEQAKPYLEKSPEIKKLVDENADALKKGNFAELYEKIKSGDMGGLEKYVKSAADKAANSSTGKSVQEYMKMVPGGSEIIPKLQKLAEVANKRGDEAEKIMKDTYEEISKILSKKSEEVEKLAKKTKEEGKKEAEK